MMPCRVPNRGTAREFMFSVRDPRELAIVPPAADVRAAHGYPCEPVPPRGNSKPHRPPRQPRSTPPSQLLEPNGSSREFTADGMGVTATRNQAIESCTDDFVLLTDADSVALMLSVAAQESADVVVPNAVISLPYRERCPTERESGGRSANRLGMSPADQ